MTESEMNHAQMLYLRLSRRLASKETLVSDLHLLNSHADRSFSDSHSLGKFQPSYSLAFVASVCNKPNNINEFFSFPHERLSVQTDGAGHQHTLRKAEDSSHIFASEP